MTVPLKPENFIGKGGAYPAEPSCVGFTSIEVLPFLKNRPWDEIALAYVMGLRPEKIRVVDGGMHADACSNRVTLMLHEGRIQSITQEVAVWLPDGVEDGHDLDKKSGNTA